MARKSVKVYFPIPLAIAIERMTEDHGISEDEILRWAFVEYAMARGYLGQQHLDPATISDRPIRSARDEAIISALKSTKDHDTVDWRVYEALGISTRDVLNYITKLLLKEQEEKNKDTRNCSSFTHEGRLVSEPVLKP